MILAIVTIGAVQDSGIIGHAQNAATDYNDEKAKEESAIVGYETLIESNLPGENGGGDTELSSDPTVAATTIAQAQADNMLTKTVNSSITDKYNNKITIPAGFKILVDGTTGYNANNIDVTKGIVIQDAELNEFVWIPVGENITNGTKTEPIKLSRYTFNSSTGVETDVGDAVISNYYQELATSSYGNATANNLSGFLSSANTNKGYYIARYEAGVTGYDSSKTITSNSNNETNWTGYVAEEGKELKLVSKSGQQDWNYVTQNKASELCRNMYPTNTNYKSDLINSYAWDTAIVFIQTFGEETDANKYSISDDVSSNKYCNIYYMSGCHIEWSTETSSSASYPCVLRGGYFVPFSWRWLRL